jgi:hypothetical protein
VRLGINHKFQLMISTEPADSCACLLANLNSLVCDFISRQKIGGTSFTYFTMKQIAVHPPERFAAPEKAYIVPRVLELTYTAYDLRPWADELEAYDFRPVDERGRPFSWNPNRRAQLRAELDAYYARLYGLDRDELRYILEPADVMGPIGAAERNDLLEVLDDRVGTRSTLITSQLPVKAWHTYLDDPTLADAILDRVVHSSHKIELKGRSLRDQSKPAPGEADPGDQA